MSDRPCMLNPEKWRVKRIDVSIPRAATIVRPFQLPPLPQPPDSFRIVTVWAIWPPQWALEHDPLLFYRDWDKAFQAAWDRAQFAASPPFQQTIGEEISGQA